MPKLSRIFVVLLVPSLFVDPTLAFAYMTTLAPHGGERASEARVRGDIFSSQALSPVPAAVPSHSFDHTPVKIARQTTGLTAREKHRLGEHLSNVRLLRSRLVRAIQLSRSDIPGDEDLRGLLKVISRNLGAFRRTRGIFSDPAQKIYEVRQQDPRTAEYRQNVKVLLAQTLAKVDQYLADPAAAPEPGGAWFENVTYIARWAWLETPFVLLLGLASSISTVNYFVSHHAWHPWFLVMALSGLTNAGISYAAFHLPHLWRGRAYFKGITHFAQRHATAGFLIGVTGFLTSGLPHLGQDALHLSTIVFVWICQILQVATLINLHVHRDRQEVRMLQLPPLRKHVLARLERFKDTLRQIDTLEAGVRRWLESIDGLLYFASDRPVYGEPEIRRLSSMFEFSPNAPVEQQLQFYERVLPILENTMARHSEILTQLRFELNSIIGSQMNDETRSTAERIETKLKEEVGDSVKWLEGLFNLPENPPNVLANGDRHRFYDVPVNGDQPQDIARLRAVLYKLARFIPAHHAALLSSIQITRYSNLLTSRKAGFTSGDGTTISIDFNNVGNKELRSVIVHEMGHVTQNHLPGAADLWNSIQPYPLRYRILLLWPRYLVAGAANIISKGVRLPLEDWLDDYVFEIWAGWLIKKGAPFVTPYAMLTLAEDYAESYEQFGLVNAAFRERTETNPGVERKYETMRTIYDLLKADTDAPTGNDFRRAA